jgi:hypothetical protein
MDDLTAIRNFRAERDSEPAAAREAIWRALEARMDAAAAEARSFGETVAGARPGGELGGAAARPSAPTRPAGPRHGLFARRRRVLAFAGAVALAAVVAGTLVLSSGPTTQPASAAEILHEAAGAAVASGGPTTLVPGPGQFYFHKERQLGIVGWVTPVPGPKADTPAVTISGTLDVPGAYNALVPVTVEEWVASDGGGRRREALGTLQFWSPAEEAHWRAAGSPPPPPFNAEYRRLYPRAFERARKANAHVIDYTQKGFGNRFHFPDTSGLPTKPKALRHAIEADAIEVTGFQLIEPKGKAKRLDAVQTKEQLVNVLFDGAPTPRLQAAIFDALAELPGIEAVPTTDSIGRDGDAITYATREGIRAEFLFAPETSDLLATRGVLVNPAASASFKGLPAGTTLNERDFIDAGVVDSTRATPAGPVAKG